MEDSLLKKNTLLFLSTLSYIIQYSTAFQNCPASTLTVSYTTCPSTEEAWRAAAIRKNCSSIPQNCTSPENFVYHCVTNAFRNETVEVCAPAIFLLGFCPEYNFRGERIQDNYNADCKQFTKPCPNRIESWKSYQFPECTTIDGTNILNSNEVESRPQDLKINDTSNELGTHPKEGMESTETIILISCFGIVSVVISSIAMLIFIRQRRKRKTPRAMRQPSSDLEKEALNQSTDNGNV